MTSDQHIVQEHKDQKTATGKVSFTNEKSPDGPSLEKSVTGKIGEDEGVENQGDAVEMTDTPEGRIGGLAESISSENDIKSDDSLSDDLANRLMIAEQKAEEYQGNVLRLQAEMENLRKRSVREVENAHKYGLDRFVSELLPVKDSLELGVAATNDENVDVVSMREGMELTLKMFGTVMEKFGIEEVFPSQGERFDPERHQAMSVQDDKEKESGTVLVVIQKGCLLNGRLVRPAMVVVAK
uniref:Protein GrpE n=1 Tax=Candidatus Kentrum sp. TUN TaxID=2126343 RepID=A0A450ZQK4_9GAMM|nr:MAG: molecular chaperone GrpE [Candidatus Kentron sp. TUN]VFK56312.1 MAG: molecular chaperone GrpE [Candidatus Kentron sp. TUN]VFK62242.1 MAG: molecular chaperone GrpE [Candidatus Kentron sp. TUN]